MIAFEDANGMIQNYLTNTLIAQEKQMDKGYKLPLSDALFCARDNVRNKMFFKSICTAVETLKKKQDKVMVVDAGSGVGILGVYALLAGAEKCFFLENNPHSLEYSRGLIGKLGYKDKAHFIQCDATTVELPTPYDLLISETLTSGFVDEDFVEIVNHLRQFGKTDSIIIPEGFEMTVTEKDKSGAELGASTVKIDSYSPITRAAKTIKNPQAKTLTYHTKATLFDDITLESGECISFLNERTVQTAT